MSDQIPYHDASEEWEEVWLLFAQEGQEALDLVEEMLLELESDPTDAGQVARLFRAMHTFKGGARMMGLSVLESLAHHAEDLVALVRDEGVRLTPDMVDLLLEVLDRLREMLEHALAHRSDADASQVEGLAARLQAMLAACQEEGGSWKGKKGKEEQEEKGTREQGNKQIEVSGRSNPKHRAGTASKIRNPKSEIRNPEGEEVIDPATDPGYVRIFLELAEEELGRLHAALEALAGGDEKAAEEIKGSVEILRHAAEQMGYDRLVAHLDDLLVAVQQPGHEKHRARLKDLELALLEEIGHTQDAVSPLHSPPSPFHSPSSPLPSEALTNFTGTLGELVTAHATLHHVVGRLTEVDPLEVVTRLMRQTNGDCERARQEMRGVLESWAEDVRALVQVETEMGAALEQLQEAALTLRTRPAGEILEPLQDLVQEAARTQGKQVELDVTGAELALDQRALKVLAAPLRRLTTFAVTHSIEAPAQREAAGLPATGRISVVVRQSEDRVQVVVEDDGRGIDRAAVLERARELGWASDHSASPEALSEWVLGREFGPVGSTGEAEGLDLAALNAELAAHQGQLEVVSEPGQGTRFTLELPLDQRIIDGMVVRVGAVHYVAPIQAIRRIVKPEETQIVHASADGGQNMLRMGEDLVPVRTLRSDIATNGYQDRLILVVEQDEQAVALVVNDLIGQQQVLVRPLQGRLAGIRHASGYALLGDDEVGVVLDPRAILS